LHRGFPGGGKSSYRGDLSEGSFSIKGNIMKKLFAVMGVLMVIGVTGCNTMKGMGKDVERGGEKVQDAATKQQNK
jgi:predicted small secreted protein